MRVLMPLVLLGLGGCLVGRGRREGGYVVGLWWWWRWWKVASRRHGGHTSSWGSKGRIGRRRVVVQVGRVANNHRGWLGGAKRLNLLWRVDAWWYHSSR